MAGSIFTKRNAGLLAGVFTLAMLSRFDSIISPSIASIQASFPNAEPSTVESIATVGATAAVVSALLFGKLMEWLTFKAAGMISCAFIAFGGLMPLAFHSSVGQLLLFAVIAGFGAGILTTVLPSLTARFFHGSQLSGLMGKVLAMQDGSSMVVLAVGGLLAAGGWIRNYWLYGLALLGLVLVAVFVPGVNAADPEQVFTDQPVKAGADAVAASDGDQAGAGRRKQSVPALAVCILIGFLSIFLVAVLYNKLSVYIAQYHLGGADASGFALMFNTGSSVVIGLSINRLRHFLRDYTLPFAFVLMAVGALVLLATHAFPLACLAAFLVGSGSAVIMASCPFLLSNLAERRRYPLVMGVFSAMTSLGFTASTWVFKLAADFLGGDPLQVSLWGMVLIALVAAGALALGRFQPRIEARYIPR
ncbi:MFS transporter [Bifidobacterium xylocopae]|nr:MFS transporter [Bifidobacterium xylocopae]